MFPLVFFLLFFLTLTVVAEYKQIYFYSTGETAGTWCVFLSMIWIKIWQLRHKKKKKKSFANDLILFIKLAKVFFCAFIVRF